MTLSPSKMPLLRLLVALLAARPAGLFLGEGDLGHNPVKFPLLFSFLPFLLDD